MARPADEESIIEHEARDPEETEEERRRRLGVGEFYDPMLKPGAAALRDPAVYAIDKSKSQ